MVVCGGLWSLAGSLRLFVVVCGSFLVVCGCLLWFLVICWWFVVVRGCFSNYDVNVAIEKK